MAATVSEYMIDRLSDWGVRRIFGYSGDGINGILGALDKAQDKMEFVQVRHEEMAAFMACAHAKFTGEVGVCLATSGPGAIHLLNGLYDAKKDHQPVVAIVGQQKMASLGGEYQQEVDLISLFKDVAHEFVYMASSPSQMRHLVDRAMRIAIAERTVTCIIVPADVQEMNAVEEPERAHGTVHSGVGYSAPRVVPQLEDLRKAAKILNEGKKVAILVGAGAKGAVDEVIEVANRLQCGVAKALLGKATLPDDLSFVTGPIGLLGSKPSWDMMSSCDTLLMIGSGFPYSEFLPKEGQAKGVQIDIDAHMLSIRFPMEANLVGDAKETLQALLPYLEQKRETAWREEIEENVRQWWKTLESRAMKEADPVNPQRVFWELSPRLPENSILCCDTGSTTNWYARDLKIRRGMLASNSGGLATMGNGMPYALAAKFAHPDRPVIAIVGDGAMQMNGLNCMITLQKYCKLWSNPQFVILVLNNRDLNQVTWEQRVLVGNPEFKGAQDIPDFSYTAYAEILGFDHYLIDKPAGIGDTWDRALNSTRPVLVEAFTDPNVPTIPPHMTGEQMTHFMKSIFKGDAEVLGVLKQSIKDAASSFLKS